MLADKSRYGKGFCDPVSWLWWRKKSSLLDKAEIFLNLGYNTFLVDFMGSGGSDGNQTTIGFYEAEEVKTAFNYLEACGEKNIILFGTSMGAAAIMKAQRPLRYQIV